MRPVHEIAQDVHACATSHEPAVCLMGNVRADEVAYLAEYATAASLAPKSSSPMPSEERCQFCPHCTGEPEEKLRTLALRAGSCGASVTGDPISTRVFLCDLPKGHSGRHEAQNRDLGGGWTGGVSWKRSPADDRAAPGSPSPSITTGAAWKRGQQYGLVRASAEARIAGHIALADMLMRASTIDLHDRPEGVRAEDWDLEKREAADGSGEACPTCKRALP